MAEEPAVSEAFAASNPSLEAAPIDTTTSANTAATHSKGASNDFSFLADAFAAPSTSSSTTSSLPLASVTENGNGNGHARVPSSVPTTSTTQSTQPFDLLSAFGDFSASVAPKAEVVAATIEETPPSSAPQPEVSTPDLPATATVVAPPSTAQAQGDEASPRHDMSVEVNQVKTNEPEPDISQAPSSSSAASSTSTSTSSESKAKSSASGITLPSVYVAARIRPFNQR
jgi:hypothetical protein